jgi:hypothetical protein
MAQLADTSTGRNPIGVNEPIIHDALLRAGKVNFDSKAARSAQKCAISVILWTSSNAFR